MNLLRLRQLLLLALLLFTAHLGWSQGITTAAMNGVISDKTGMGLPGATVIAVHTPTNTQYVVPTNSDGRFNLQNMRVGGPYTVKVSFVGYRDVQRDGVFLSLGQNLRFDVKLDDAATELTEVTVSGRRDPVMNADHTGAQTTVQRETIERLPTLNRSLNDFTRLTPQSNGGQGFGGRSSSFNNITIDGAIFNNAFGLSSTVGGQAGAQPISLDAIDQIQVSIAPFDVRQGSFTGAGINVVTRSGSNKFSASVYDFYRNQRYVGDQVGNVHSPYTTFNLNNVGFRIGGPIIKDKVFFFLNAERERRNDPPTGNYTANTGTTPPPVGGTVSSASAKDLDALSAFLVSQYGYNPGPYQGYQLQSNSDKITARIDWNINQNNRFNIKYNYLKSYSDIAPSTSGAIAGQRSQSYFGLPYQSSYYRINNNLNSIIAELNSTLGGGKYSNNLTGGYSAFRDYRESTAGIFPLVDIGTSQGLSSASTSPATNQAGITAQNSLTTFGYEPFSAFNILNSDVYQLGDNFTAYLGKHNVTVGTYNEFYKFRNGFAPNYYGNYSYNSLEDFYASAGFSYNRSTATATPLAPGTARPGPERYNLQYSTLPGGEFPYADLKAAQFGLYLQDEWSPKQNIKVTYGVRADLPFVTSDLQQNTAVAALTFRDGVKINTGELPKKQVLFSPRVGFNWDVNDDRKTQLRGGTGIFTGRVPFVWLSNQASNNGVQFGSFSTTGAVAVGNNVGASIYPFNPDPSAYVPKNATANTAYNLAVTDKDFKFPQVWRSNLAIDQDLGSGVIATLEAFYTKDINAVYHQNVNLPGSEASPFARANGADNRPIFYTLGAVPTTGANAGLAAATKNYQIYGSVPANQGGNTAARPNISDAILMRNTSLGYSYGITAQLQKTFNNGVYASVAYTYSDARSVNDGGSVASTIYSARQVSGDPNANVLSYSQYLLTHRVIGSLSYRHEYLGHLGTTLSMFYQGAPSGRFSYVYSGDMNGDNQSANDLMYIPRNAGEINLRDITLPAGAGTYTAAQQYTDLDNFINQDKYLSKHRGEYAERNGAVLPWQHQLDVRLLQDIFTNIGTNRNTLQLSLDIFNIGNMLNSNWGISPIANRTNPLTFDGYNAAGQPVFEYRYFTNPSANADGSANAGAKLTDTYRNNTGSINSRWQGQVGVRYLFN